MAFILVDHERVFTFGLINLLPRSCLFRLHCASSGHRPLISLSPCSIQDNFSWKNDSKLLILFFLRKMFYAVIGPSFSLSFFSLKPFHFSCYSVIFRSISFSIVFVSALFSFLWSGSKVIMTLVLMGPRWLLFCPGLIWVKFMMGFVPQLKHLLPHHIRGIFFRGSRPSLVFTLVGESYGAMPDSSFFIGVRYSVLHQHFCTCAPG